MLLSPDACRAILSDHLPCLAARSAALIQDGWCSLVLDVNGEYISVLPACPKSQLSLRKSCVMSFYYIEYAQMTSDEPMLREAVARLNNAR